MDDIYEATEKQKAEEANRPPLVPAEKINGTNRRARTREIGSRYKSPTPAPRRFPSPNITRTDRAPPLPKRSLSAERKRPTTPPSPKNLSTPVHDSSLDPQFSSRRTISSRFPESLWPSTMRSLNASLQSDSSSLLTSKREKPVTIVSLGRKPASERKKTPTRGSNGLDQLEGSKTVDLLQTRFIEQHRWPSRVGGKITSNFLSRSVDLSDRIFRTPTLSSATRRTAMFDDENGRPQTVSQALPASVSRPSSPSKSSIISRSMTSPSRTRPSATPAASRGVSPSRIRPMSPSRPNAASSTSVLSFIADFRRGSKASNLIEDAHQLKLLHNRYLQWRYINVQADSVLHTQKHTTEKTLCNASHTVSALRDSVASKRIHLQHLRLILKLRSLLNMQMAYLDDWDVQENLHNDMLYSFIEDLESSTLRLPVTTGAVVDIESLKLALYSAENVMQMIQSSLSSCFTRGEGVNNLFSELADIYSKNRLLLHEYEALLRSTDSMQVEEYSLRSHLMQTKQESTK